MSMHCGVRTYSTYVAVQSELTTMIPLVSVTSISTIIIRVVTGAQGRCVVQELRRLSEQQVWHSVDLQLLFLLFLLLFVFQFSHIKC